MMWCRASGPGRGGVRVLVAVMFALCLPLLGAGLAGASPSPSPLIPAWSVTGSGRIHQSSPEIADVNGDGIPEIVYGDLDGWVHVLTVDGRELPGWPQQAKPDGVHATAVEASPTVVDLNGDGQKEIVVGAGSTWVRNQNGGVVTFNGDGSVRWRFLTRDVSNLTTQQQGADGYTEGVFSTPAVGDITGDGHPDIVFGAWDNNIYALDRNGNVIPGFPFPQDDTVWSSPALYDSNGDGRLEIFIGGDSSAGSRVGWAGGVFRALAWSNGVVRELWPHKRVDEVVGGSPAIGDIDGDGRPEAVVNTGGFYDNAASRQVYAWHLDDGSPVAGWPVSTGGINSGGVALGDLDGDGHPEVVVTSRDGGVYAFHGNGSLYWHTSPGDHGELVSYPIIADANGDGTQDVIAGDGAATYVLDGHDGSLVYNRIGTGLTYQNAAAVADFGSRGWMLIVAGMTSSGGAVSAYSIPTPGATPDWPMWRKNAAHLGAPPSGGGIGPGLCTRPVNPVSRPSDDSAHGYWVLGIDGSVYAFGAPFFGSLPGMGVHSLTASLVPTVSGGGYWILARDGGVFSFGDAAFYGSMGGRALNAPIISMAPTPSGNGYWLLAGDGGVFSFGDARFWGSTGAMRLNAPIIAMAPTKTGNGYWLLALDGGIFSFGDANFHGSMGGARLNAPVISIATAPAGDGYWLLGADGGVFSFGVPFYGSVPGTGVCLPPRSVQIRPTATGNGYWLLAGDGGVFSFGDAKYFGAQPGLTFANMAVDMGVRK